MKHQVKLRINKVKSKFILFSQVLQVLLLVVLTKEEEDGEGGKTSSSALYPHTFFGESTGKGSTDFRSGIQNSEFGKSGIPRSEKSLLKSPLSSQRNAFQRNTFFDAPLTNHQSINTFGSGRIGKKSSVESSPQVQSQVVQHPQNKKSKSQMELMKTLHEDVQHHLQEVPSPQIQDAKPQLLKLSVPRFAFRNSRNEVKTLKQIQEEVQSLLKAQNAIKHGMEKIVQEVQREIQVRNQERIFQEQNVKSGNAQSQFKPVKKLKILMNVVPRTTQNSRGLSRENSKPIEIIRQSSERGFKPSQINRHLSPEM